MIIPVVAGCQVASVAPEPAPICALLRCGRGKKGAVARRRASYTVSSFSASETSEAAQGCAYTWRRGYMVVWLR